MKNTVFERMDEQIAQKLVACFQGLDSHMCLKQQGKRPLSLHVAISPVRRAE